MEKMEMMTVGKLQFDQNNLLPAGHFGKKFKGKYENEIDIAIEQVEKVQFTLQISSLWKSQNHSNILHYYCTEETSVHILIASELTAGTLKDVIKGNYQGPPVGRDCRSILLQIIEGLSHLHDKNIVHRNLKPSTICISIPEGRTGPLLKLADFGFSRVINKRESFALWKIIGSLSWLPAEIYHATKFTSAMDTFALGCTFAYFLSGGVHPYGTVKEERLDRIKRKEAMTSTVQELIKTTGAFTLISSMLSSDSEQRPSCLSVLNDCYFKPAIANDLFPIKIKEEPMDDDIIFVEHFHASDSQHQTQIESIKDSTPSSLLNEPQGESLATVMCEEPISSPHQVNDFPETFLASADKTDELESCREPKKELFNTILPNQQRSLDAGLLIANEELSVAEKNKKRSKKLRNSKMTTAAMEQTTEMKGSKSQLSDLASEIYHPRTSAEKGRLAIRSQLSVKPRKKRLKEVRGSENGLIAIRKQPGKSVGDEDMEPNRMTRSSSTEDSQPARAKYKTLADFHRQETYAKYVKAHISIGVIVRCHSQLLKLDEGAIGTVTQIHDEDDVLSYNLEVDWQGKEKMWVRFNEIEMLDNEDADDEKRKSLEGSEDMTPILLTNSEAVRRKRRSSPTPSTLDINSVQRNKSPVKLPDSLPKRVTRSHVRRSATRSKPPSRSIGPAAHPNPAVEEVTSGPSSQQASIKPNKRSRSFPSNSENPSFPVRRHSARLHN